MTYSYKLTAKDFEYLNWRVDEENEGHDDEFRFAGTIQPSGYQLRVRDIFTNIEDRKIASGFVAYFGYYNWSFFALTIEGDFIYADDIKPEADGIILATEGRKKINPDDINTLSAYDYAFNFSLYTEDYITETK